MKTMREETPRRSVTLRRWVLIILVLWVAFTMGKNYASTYGTPPTWVCLQDNAGVHWAPLDLSTHEFNGLVGQFCGYSRSNPYEPPVNAPRPTGN